MRPLAVLVEGHGSRVQRGSHCPYFAPGDQDTLRPICRALDPAPPISPSRKLSFCTATAHRDCPAFVATGRAAEASPSSAVRRRNHPLIRSLAWTVAIPIVIVVLIVLALALTQ